MVAKSLLEKVPSDRSDTISISPMDLTNSGLRSGAYANKNYCGKDTSDWKVVTPLALEDLHADSPFFASSSSRVLPCFDAKEIHLGQLLGVGEFGAVYEVARITDDSRKQLKVLMHRSSASLNKEESFGLFQDEGYSHGEDQTEGGDMSSVLELEEAEEKRGTIRERCWKQGKARYAVKRLRSGTSKRKVLHASVDLAAEKEFLASMKHPNIIRLRGTVGYPGHPGYMLLMDRLHVSMKQKLHEWKQDVRGTMGYLGMRVRHRKAHIGLLSERVVAAYDVARALNFLHGHNIVYRDLKPENVGFDIRGDVRLFDFGIARELKPKDRIKASDDYRCSGLTGSRRWMAPEVCLCLPYGLKADVYSFGIFFYQLLALKLPFGNIQEDWHYRWVVKRGTRPSIPNSLPGFLRDKIKACWSPNPSDRPSFKDICAGFPEHIESLQMTKQRRSIVDRSRHLLDKSIHSGHFTPSGHLTPSAHMLFES